jgi:hypothetical protein
MELFADPFGHGRGSRRPPLLDHEVLDDTAEITARVRQPGHGEAGASGPIQDSPSSKIHAPTDAYEAVFMP